MHFKSVDLAEQMTLLDAQLFMHLDSAELILWVQEQNEDKSPNLTKFTEHFNNMSYWCRSVTKNMTTNTVCIKDLELTLVKEVR